MSGYYNKIVDGGWVRDRILKTWREKLGAKDEDMPGRKEPPR